MEYFGVFELGLEGCFKEEELIQFLRGKPPRIGVQNNTQVCYETFTYTKLYQSVSSNRGDEVRAFRLKRKSTIGKLKQEFSSIIRAELDAEVSTNPNMLAHSRQAFQPEATTEQELGTSPNMSVAVLGSSLHSPIGDLELDTDHQTKVDRLKQEASMLFCAFVTRW